MTDTQLSKSLQVYKALSDETRLKIALTVSKSHQCPTAECTKQLELTQPTISHHIKVLLEAGVILESKSGTSKQYTLNTKHLRDLGIVLADSSN